MTNHAALIATLQTGQVNQSAQIKVLSDKGKSQKAQRTKAINDIGAFAGLMAAVYLLLSWVLSTF